MSKGGWSKNAQIQVDMGVVGGPIEFQSSDRVKLIEVAASHDPEKSIVGDGEDLFGAPRMILSSFSQKTGCGTVGAARA